MRKKILIVGSCNVDLVFNIPRFHHPGETMLAERQSTFLGGKGANQAMSSKRLGGNVCFITKVGNDLYGKSYRRRLIKNGLDRKPILEDRKVPTGMAVIELTPKGENRILVFPGANGSLSATDLKGLQSCWRGVEVFTTQLEIPLSTVERGLRLAKEEGALTLLNPSPPARLSPHLLSFVDFIVPNEIEAQFLTGIKWRGDQDIRKIAKRLLEMGARNVVITLGSRGLYFKNRSDEIRMKAYRVKVIDTTAAGDAFLGALATGLAEKKPIQEALKFANAAGALATTKLGAQPSLPWRKELSSFLRNHMLN
ncbi:MAG TPA: ribokinase [Thermodesulfobacteriota bacterium]|nr:ribokinase [Thermodesulfobacteriota bacterium]